MTLIEFLICCAVATLIGVIAAIAVNAKSSQPPPPTCESQGGKTVPDGYVHIWSGKSVILIPKKRCQL